MGLDIKGKHISIGALGTRSSLSFLCRINFVITHPELDPDPAAKLFPSFQTPMYLTLSHPGTTFTITLSKSLSLGISRCPHLNTPLYCDTAGSGAAARPAVNQGTRLGTRLLEAQGA